jgi:LPS export ABC transporter permease LptG/LPS export ABC transporter permease LptF
MFRTIDRHILREIIPPFIIALFLFTFLLMIPPIMEVAEELIVKGVDTITVIKLMATLVPQGLGITIPMALLMGILVGLGRLSSDREAVALQACGVSLTRMFRPLLVFASVAALITSYVLIVALPDANQAFREITFRAVATRAEGEVRARVFDEYFPGVVLYVREVLPDGGGWADVFLADSRSSDQPDVYVAEKGQVILNREDRQVDIILSDGSGHQVNPLEPETYEVHNFDEAVIAINAETIFPTAGPQRGYRELSILELQAEAAALSAADLSPHRPVMEIHRKFSIPIACLVFALIGLGLGVTSRKDGKLASFSLGTAVIFGYYVFMYGAEAMAKGGLVSPHLAMWLPNIVLGLLGLGLVVLKSRSVERRFALPVTLRRHKNTEPDTSRVTSAPRLSLSVKPIPQLGPLRLNILDWYVTRTYFAIAGISFVGLLGIFYLSTFIDLSDKLFKGETTTSRLAEYFWYATPQFAYYVIPIAGLVSTLVTIGLLTKSSELTVMKACGISLYRTALPIFLISLLWSSVLFAMSETILATSNRRAEAINDEIRTGASTSVDVFNRRWIAGKDDSIYNYLSFRPNLDQFENLSVYQFHGRPWQLARRTFAENVNFSKEEANWTGTNIWVRDFTSVGPNGSALASDDVRTLTFLEPPSYFKSEPPDAELMNARELNNYVETLSSSGFDVRQLVVELHRKISFPFVTLVLTLIAIPFAVTMGPRGALYGIGVGISLACTYWIVMSVFGAIGSAGMLGPVLSAWAPNLLFGASAAYLLLTVRT